MAQIWTEKHLQIALQHTLTPSARDLYEYLVLEGYEGKPQVLDLREFNKFILKRRGKAYDRRTIKAARIFLEEKGLLTACQKFTAFVHHVTLRAISALFKPKKQGDNQCRSRSLIATFQAPNSTSAAQGAHTTTTELKIDTRIPEWAEDFAQDIETNLDLCEQAGINYSAEDAVFILDCDPEEVKAAIAYTLPRAKKNPAGYLRKCLEKRYWESKQPACFSDVLIAIARYVKGES